MTRRIQALLAWLPAILAGLAAGLFLARATSEMWPAQLGRLTTRPNIAGVTVATGVIFACLRWAWQRLIQRFTVNPQMTSAPLIAFSLLLIYVVWPDVNLLIALILMIAATGLSLAIALHVMIPVERQRLLAWAVPLALVVVVLAAYLQTVGRTVGAADTFEFQVVAPTLGVAHPTGYPLFILIGKLFSLIPLGQVAWRVNLVSVACAATAVLFLYFALLHLTGQRAMSALAALCLAFSRVFWSQATEAEVYALNAVFVAAILWLLVSRINTAQSAPASKRWLFVLAAVYGLSLTNHLTMIILAPAIALSVLFARLPWRRIDMLFVAGCFLAPLLVELYLPLRWPALHNGEWMPLKDFVLYITGQQFGGAMQFGLWRDPTRWNIVSQLMLNAFGPIGAALAAVGWIWLAVRQCRIAALTLVAYAGYWFYGLVYNVPDISVFIIPAHILMALWIGVAAAALIRWLANLADNKLSNSLARWVKPFGWVALAVLPLSLAWTSGPSVDQSNAGRELYDWGKYVMSLPMPTGSAILADSEKIAPLYYLKRIENVRSDVDTFVLGDEGLYRAKLDQLIAGGRPVYLARYLPGLAGLYRLHSLGPLVRVTTKPMTLPPPMQKQLDNVNWGGGQVALLGFDVEPGQDDVAWRITLYWLARTKLDASYHVRLRWVGPSGQVWWLDHGAHPVNGYNPTVAWQEGEIVADYHEIPADPTIPPGLLRLDVGLFLPFRDEGLNYDGGDDPWFTLAMLEQLTLPPPDYSKMMRATFGDELLISGASDPGVLPPDEPANVELEWSHLRAGPDRTLRLRWVDAKGATVSSMQIQPYAGEYPTSQWPAGQSLASRVTITAPSTSGVYTLRAGWLSEDGRELPARCAWLAPITQDCAIGTLQVVGQARAGEQGINFDNQVLLLNAQIGQTELSPNETLDVNLKWQGLRQWNADYKVFVQLVGPDGKLHGQVDQWPLDGTLATHDWTPGRLVDDPYHVTLAGDAPPGTYQVIVGWYLLATMDRLSVVDEQARPVDDKVIIGTFNVSGQ